MLNRYSGSLFTAQEMKAKIESIEPNLDLVYLAGKRIYLVGTAHVSHQSAELVEKSIERYKPDTVCLELCEARYQSLRDPNRWKNTDIVQVIRSGRAYVLLAQLVLASFQKRLAARFNIKPGEEMLRAISTAETVGSRLELVDRDVKITLRRAWAGASLWSACKTFCLFLGSIFTREEISEEEIERLKTTDVMTAVMEEFSSYLPGVKRSLIDERDRYMASKIREAPGECVMAVVGAGHVVGIKELLDREIDRRPLEEIPPPRFMTRCLHWGIPLAFVLLLVLGFFQSGIALSAEMVRTWVLTTGTLAALGALIGLGHPLTVLAAFVSAPVTPLHPLIAVGGVCAVVEACLRRPRVADFETLVDDLQSRKGWWSNRASRILLIFLLANLGGTLGVFLGGTAMVTQLLGL